MGLGLWVGIGLWSLGFKGRKGGVKFGLGSGNCSMYLEFKRWGMGLSPRVRVCTMI